MSSLRSDVSMGTFINGFDERTSMDTTENDGLCYRSSGGSYIKILLVAALEEKKPHKDCLKIFMI